MDVAQRLGAVGAAQEGDHRDHHQQSLEAFAEQDGERAEEGGDAAFRLGGKRGLGLIKQRLGMRQALSQLRIAADDRLAEAGHRLLDPAHQRSVAGRQHPLDRLEAIEVGRKRQPVGLGAVAGRVSGHAFSQALPGKPERRVAALAGGGLRVGAQVGDDSRRALRTELRLELGRSQRDQGREVGDQRSDGGVVFPDALAFRRVAVSERAAVESQRPAVFLGKRRIALHRRALEALGDDLVEAEDAAVARPGAFGEGDRRRVELGESGRRPFALGAVARRAILGVERGAAGDVGRLGPAPAALDMPRAGGRRATWLASRCRRERPWRRWRSAASCESAISAALAGLAGSAATLPATLDENSTISSYSSWLITRPSATASR